MYCCNYYGKSSPFVVRKKKDKSYYKKRHLLELCYFVSNQYIHIEIVKIL